MTTLFQPRSMQCPVESARSNKHQYFTCSFTVRPSGQTKHRRVVSGRRLTEVKSGWKQRHKPKPTSDWQGTVSILADSTLDEFHITWSLRRYSCWLTVGPSISIGVNWDRGCWCYTSLTTVHHLLTSPGIPILIHFFVCSRMDVRPPGGLLHRAFSLIKAFNTG